jgi:hypothetical protein
MVPDDPGQPLARVLCLRYGEMSCGTPPYFSPDGRTVAIGDECGRVSLMKTATGQQRLRFRAYGMNAILPIAFSADGRMLAVGCVEWFKEPEPVQIWDLTGSEQNRAARLTSVEAEWQRLQKGATLFRDRARKKWPLSA